jgi:magnesium transporter
MLDKRVKLRLEAMRRLMRKGASANLRRIVERTHPADLAAIHSELNDLEQGRFFQVLQDTDMAGEVLTMLDRQSQDYLLNSLGIEEIGDILSDINSDDAADILSTLSEERREEVLSAMKTEDSEDIGKLLVYPEDSAGGIMNTAFFALPDTMTAREAIEAIQGDEEGAETAFYLYVVDGVGKLLGVVSLRQLITSGQATSLRKIMQSDVISVDVETDQEEVARLVARYDLLAIPVVTDERHLVGIITVDDVLDVMREEATEDIYKMAGTSQEELVHGNRVLPIFRIRLPWLVINLVGGVLTGNILWMFRATVEEVIALVSFIPVITAMGGNVGTQSAAILVRGFATGRMEFQGLAGYLWKELRVGALLGIACGTLVGGAAYLWHGNPALGAVVAVSMLSAMLVATMMGTLAPAFMRKINVDPAVASGPFVTTANDISGILIYLTVATAMLHLLR